MEAECLKHILKENRYPGRGIAIGKSKSGRHAVLAYFIMGRSENSRNRIFIEDGEGLRTEFFSPDGQADPSLIIYAPVRVLGTRTIVANGDHSDTIYEQMDRGGSFERALRTREFEPDAPNYTPRIAGMLEVKSGKFCYLLSILKTNHGNPQSCQRNLFDYSNPLSGEGHFIHTYRHDGNPLLSFEGEPARIEIPDSIDRFTEDIWEGLDVANRISLYVRYIKIEDGSYQSRLINKNKA